jgi:hypothetical protein
MQENKYEQLFAKHGKFYYMQSAKHTAATYEKYHCSLKS